MPSGSSDLLVRLFNPDLQAVTYRPDADYWYEALDASRSGAGIVVTQETAMKISAFFACLRVLGETVLTAPLKVYRKLPNGDRVEAPEHPLWPILHDGDPNDDQTSEEWRETHVVHTGMRGTSYSEIKSGERGPISELEYLHPDRVSPERTPDGVLRYRVRNENTGGERTLAARHIFRFPGLSSNGVTGLSVLEHARETLGISAALQMMAGKSFANGANIRGVLEMAGTLRDAQVAQRLRDQWNETYGGAANAGKTVILENGMQYKGVSMSNEDAQMLASEQWQVADVARWFRMPLIMIQEYANSTNWGTGIESTQIGFVVFTMLPWFIRMEKRINKQLIEPLGPGYFAEFLPEALLRGDVKSRFEAYQIAAGGNAPWMNRNEIRRRENMNRGPADLDDFLQPKNMGVAGEEPPAPAQLPARGPQNGAEEPAALAASVDPRLQGYATTLAGQIVRKESAAIERLAKRYADDGAGWQRELGSFYTDVAADIAERCQVPVDLASRYADHWQSTIWERGAGVTDGWEAGKVSELVGMMLSPEVLG